MPTKVVLCPWSDANTQFLKVQGRAPSLFVKTYSVVFVIVYRSVMKPVGQAVSNCKHGDANASPCIIVNLAAQAKL